MSELPAESVSLERFPCGLSSAAVVLTFLDGSRKDVDFVAGLLAVRQAADTLSLSPMIGWCVADKPPAPPTLTEWESTDEELMMMLGGGIRHRGSSPAHRL